MPFGLKEKDIKLISDIFYLNKKVEEVIIFGSRAMGTERPASDIDLAVKGKNITASDILTLRTRLAELPLPYEFDVVNYHTISVKEFIKHINKHGVCFYKKPTEKNWKTYRLSEILNLVGGGTPKTTVPEYWNGDIPWLSVVDFRNDIKRVYKTEKTITEKGLNESSTKILKEGQIIISARGTVGELAVLGRDMAFNQSCYGIYANEKTENNFLYYLLKDSIGKIKKNTHGAVFDTITKQTFDNIEVTIPETIDEQTEIASILSSLDDKIELNLQMIQTLEAMAHAIFKEWFVNFNFPGFDGELVDGLPKGWKISKLSEIISFVVDNRGKTPPIIEDANEGIPLIEVNALINSPIVAQQHLAKKFVDEETYENWFRKGHPKKGDVLFSTVGSIGEIAISFGEKICIAQNIIALRSKFRGSFLYFTLKSIKQNLLSLDISSVQPSIKVPHLLSQGIIVPSKTLINEFENTLAPFLERIFENEMEIRTLTQIRDSLLPKLMTGKIEIKN